METKRIKTRGYNATAVVMGDTILISIPFDTATNAVSVFDSFKEQKL